MTSGGRVLLAMQPGPARRWLINILGLPTVQQWSGVLSRPELRQELAQIRRQRWALIERGRTVTMSSAHADGAGGWVAVGCHGPVAVWTPAVRDAIAAVALAHGDS